MDKWWCQDVPRECSAQRYSCSPRLTGQTRIVFQPLAYTAAFSLCHTEYVCRRQISRRILFADNEREDDKFTEWSKIQTYNYKIKGRYGRATKGEWTWNILRRIFNPYSERRIRWSKGRCSIWIDILVVIGSMGARVVFLVFCHGESPGPLVPIPRFRAYIRIYQFFISPKRRAYFIFYQDESGYVLQSHCTLRRFQSARHERIRHEEWNERCCLVQSRKKIHALFSTFLS